MRAQRSNSSGNAEAGFTLIEVMIAMVVIAILAAVAIPSYRSYVRRGQLAEAFTTLADARVKMEQYYQDNKFYGAAANSTACPTLPTLGAFPVVGKYFTVSCGSLGAAPAQTYTLTATGTGGLTTGYAYTVNHNGTKGTTSFDGQSSSAVCWLTKGGSCDN
ncbi:MAG TPA: type IV pilin protein [Burkholderiaceae bacterium]|nr:type IV pilin protein [Burkholderiaceae bacterium]